ncbi:MAG: F0F1 ATP synthase subunit A [marine benthic group bacterium]|nr:F0F1 ATP synthase subunit A [Gemmatimonadota bacterium]
MKRSMLAALLMASLVALPPAPVAARSAAPAGAVRSATTTISIAPQEHGETAGESEDTHGKATDQETEKHAGGAAEHGDEEGAHAEEWGTDAMMHHIVDSHELEFGSIKVALPRVPPIQIGNFEIDMSPTKHVVFLWLATLLTILTVWIAARRATRTQEEGEAPKGMLNAFETFYVYLRDDVALANIGHGGEKYVPYVVTLFFFILFANLLGLVPFGATSTSNIMVTAALALISLVVVEAAGMSELGFKGWLGTIFYAPPGLHPVMRVVMLIIMTPVELIGKLAKPFALAVRLFANMTAGHFVILALLGLILTYGSFTRITGVAAISGSLLLGLFVMFLEIFVAFLQAYIFTALTAVFIGLIRHAH